MSDREERERRIVRSGHEEESDDEVEAHRKKLTEEPAEDDESSDDVEAHSHGGRGKV